MNATSKKPDRRVPLEQRKRTEHSCDRCKSRKQKCHRVPGEERCQHCQRLDYECTVTKPRKQRLYGSAELVRMRIAMLEALVRALVPNADLSSLDSMRALGQTVGASIPEMEGGESQSSQPEPIQANELACAEPDQQQQLVQDQQGQGQYIGPASSYFFQLKLRTLLGRQQQERMCQMLLFGRNPTEETLKPSATDVLTEYEVRTIARPEQYASSAPYLAPLLDIAVIDRIIRAYFEHVNIDFPVLHEASFLENYDRWRASPQSVDNGWVCGLLCVLILGRRIDPLGTTEIQQQKWWTHFEALLPFIIFTSNIHSIQALMLAALHLHNTNHRDVCWTMTGAAVRIAIATGLHRDDIVCEGPRLARELRKLLWWTIYGFEQMQVSSHDRPSAIDGEKCTTSPPNERILGMGSNCPPGYTGWSTQLSSILYNVCRALPTAANGSGPNRVLSPAAGLLRDLNRWHTSLPQHLSLDVFHTLPDSFRRPVLLLHIQYHYTVSLLTRYSLLHHLATLSQQAASDPNHREMEMTARICCESGRRSCELLVQLDRSGKFNAVTWWDVYYVYSSTLILALGIMWHRARQHEETTINDCLSLLHACAAVVVRHLSNSALPGTMRRWIGMICDLDILAHEKLGPPRQAIRNTPSNIVPEPSTAGVLVELGSSANGTITPLPGMNMGMQSSADPTISHMDSTMMVPGDAHSNPMFAMPLMNDENAYYSWDSIGCMLLGTETLSPSLNGNMAYYTDTGH